MRLTRIKQSLNKNSKELVDSLYLMLLQGINQMLPILVMPYLMIKLGATGYGYIGFALSVIQYLVIIVDFGFNLSATKRIAVAADNKEQLSRVFWNVVAAKTLLALFTTLLLLMLTLTVPTFQTYSKAIYATLPMLVGSAFTFMWFFQGIGKIRMFSIVNTISKLALLPLIFLYVKSPDDYVLAAFLQAVVFVSTAVISNIYILYKRLTGWVKPSWAGVKEELRISFPLFLSSASTSVYTQLIVIVLGFYCTTEMVGKYSSAERIMRAVCFLIYTPLSQVFFPKISALSVKVGGEAKRLFRQVRGIILVVMTMVCIGIAVGGQWVSLFLGADYDGIDTYLYIFAFAPFFIGIGGIYGQMGLIALGNEFTNKRFRDVYFAAALVAVVLMAALIPTCQAVGACLVVVATEVFVAVMMMYNFKKHLSVC